MLDRKPEEYVADYEDYCRDVNIDPNDQNSITQYLNEYARWHVMFKGIGDLQPKLMELEGILKEKERYPLEESKKLVESHLDDYSAEKEYEVTYIDGNGKDKEIKYTPSKNTNIAGVQKELGKKQKDFFKLKDIKECKLTESWNLDLLKKGQKAVQDKLNEIDTNLTMDDIRIKTDNNGDMHITTKSDDKEICVITQNDLRKYIKEDKEVEERKLTISEKLLLEIIQSVNSEYTLDNVVCKSTPQGNVHVMTRDGKDICTVGREEFTISGDDTILIDELRNNGYWVEELDTLEEEVLIEREEFDTMAFAQLLPMSYTDYIDNNLSDYISEGADVEDIIAEYKDGLSDEDKEEFDDKLAQQYIKYKLSEGREIKTEAKVTDYINEEELDVLVKSNPIFVANNYEVLEDMILDVTSDMGHSYYKVIKNDDGSFEAYWIDKKGTRLGDNFILKESKKVEESTDLSVNDNTVIVNKNQYGYNTIAIIIDDTNKRFQLVSGQTLPTGKYKKASKKAIRDKAEILKDKGYTEVKGKFSLAESKEILTEGDYKVSFSGNATVVQGNEEAAKDTLEKVISNVPSSNIKEIEVTAKLEESSTEDIMAGKALSVKDKEILAYIEDRLEAELGRGWRGKSLIDIEDITYNAVDQYADEHGEEDINAGAYYKEIKKLTEGKVTTAMGEFEYEELKAMETEMKDAYKDYWAGRISGEDLEAVKSKLGRYLTRGQISNCQYDASREVEKVTEGKEETPEEILDRAIEEEQDAIDTYDELLDGMEDEDIIAVIEEIKKDEEDHKEILQHYDETGEVITDEDLEDKDELDEEVLEESETEMQEPVIEYVITFNDLEEEIFDNKTEADDRFEGLKASGDIDRVDQYFMKVWVWEHGGYVEDDVEVFYSK